MLSRDMLRVIFLMHCIIKCTDRAFFMFLNEYCLFRKYAFMVTVMDIKKVSSLYQKGRGKDNQKQECYLNSSLFHRETLFALKFPSKV